MRRSDDESIYSGIKKTIFTVQSRPEVHCGGDHRPYHHSPCLCPYLRQFDLYAQGKVNGVVVVGERFSADLQNGKNTSIEYHFNNYNTDMAKNLRLYLTEGILDFYRVTDPRLCRRLADYGRLYDFDHGSSGLCV